MTRLPKLTGLLVCGCLSWAAPSTADPVLDWNDIATQAIATAIAAGRPGQVVTFDYAIMHLAIFDAVEAYDKRFHPYHVVVSNPTGSPTAAVAKAAHDTLVALFPSQAASLDSAYTAFLAANNLAARSRIQCRCRLWPLPEDDDSRAVRTHTQPRRCSNEAATVESAAAVQGRSSCRTMPAPRESRRN